MANPETREVLQCVYAPRMQAPPPAPAARGAASTTPADDAPTAVLTGQVLLKQAILTAAFENATLVDPLLEAVTSKHDARAVALGHAVEAMIRGDMAAAGSTLADFSVDDVADFARSVLAAERQLIAQSDAFIRTANFCKLLNC